MHYSVRRYFDRQVEWVLERLPREVHTLLEIVPLHIEDFPSRRLMQEMNVAHRSELCGCFSGPTQEQLDAAQVPYPPIVTIFREAIYDLSRDESGNPNEERLREQIRITILHEFAHYHGIEEEEIHELGYG